MDDEAVGQVQAIGDEGGGLVGAGEGAGDDEVWLDAKTLQAGELLLDFFGALFGEGALVVIGVMGVAMLAGDAVTQ
ncbi:hypothetical protein [Candidatus Amarolinea dominans]|uniref:hypothetical protein n=1 Tax=Candidatus Amarolinea dominans TaxID=3140696 RepID=UPI0031CCCDCE